MKKSLLLLLVITSAPIFAQDIVLNNMAFGELFTYQTSRSQVGVITGNYVYTDQEKKNILAKQYVSEVYIPSKIDDYTEESYLRYNHYNDQMEFEKDGVIYYLKKEEGRTVLFTDSDVLYRVFELYGDLDYLLVKVEGENSLFVKQSSRFILPKKTRTSYGYQVNPKFRRNKDELYLSMNNGELIRLSSNKGEFYAAFGKNASVVKDYMKQQNLKHKKVEDVVKVVEYLNRL